jgi:ankyrin repeat protein
MKSNCFKISACTFLFCIFLGTLPAAEIHDALREGNIVKAMNLLTNNPSLVSSKDEDGITPLHWAAQLGQTNVVRWLLEHKADPSAIAYNNFTPLFLTTNGTIAKLLLKYGSDPNKIDSWGKTPLQNAAELGHKEVANAILETGYPLDLASALWLGKRDEAKKIIQQNPAAAKPKEDEADLWGNTSPLGIAATQGDIEIVKLLLKAGAPVDAMTEIPETGNCTPLCNAVVAKHSEIVEILCKAGANCNIAYYPIRFRIIKSPTKNVAASFKNDSMLLDYAKEYSD